MMEAHERSMNRQKLKLEAKTKIEQFEAYAFLAKAQQVKKVTFRTLEAEPSKVLRGQTNREKAVEFRTPQPSPKLQDKREPLQ